MWAPPWDPCPVCTPVPGHFLDASRGWRCAHPDFPVILFSLQPLSQPALEALLGSSGGASLEMPFFSVRWIEGCQSLHSNGSHLRCFREIPWNVWYVGGILSQFWTMTDLPHHYLPLPVSVGVWKIGRLRSSMWWFKCMSQNKTLPLHFWSQNLCRLLIDPWDVYPLLLSLTPPVLGHKNSFSSISNMLPF